MDDLIARLEAASEGSRELDAEIMRALGYQYRKRYTGVHYTDGRRSLSSVWVDPATNKWLSTHPRQFTTSLDAAMALVVDGHLVMVVNAGAKESKPVMGRATAIVGAPDDVADHEPVEAATPALALCIAALRARQEPRP